MTTAQIFRVFVDDEGKFGDKASIVIDEGRKISDVERRDITCKLNTGETIFINDLQKAHISVMYPQGEIGFAGVGVLAVSWFISTLRGNPIDKLVGRDGDIFVKKEKDLVWVQTEVNTLPQWNLKQMANPSEVEGIRLNNTSNIEHTLVWAWIDESIGFIRARTFAPDWEIPEAEGNGSGAMLLAYSLQKRIEIRHGKGSRIYAKPVSGNTAEIGGRVISSDS